MPIILMTQGAKVNSDSKIKTVWIFIFREQ